MRFLTKIIALVVIVQLIYKNYIYSQDHNYPKSSFLITGGMDAGFFHKESNNRNESLFDIILGIGYAINSKNIIGINLDYIFEGVHTQDYTIHESELFSGLFYSRFISNGIHLNLNMALTKSYEIREEGRSIETDVTDFLKLKYGGGIGKTIFFNENMAINLDLMLNRQIHYIEEFFPDFGNMKYLNISFKADIIFYFTIINQ